MDGGHKSVATGLASYKSLRHTTTRDHAAVQVLHGPAPLRAPLANWRWAGSSGRRVNVFQIETTLNNDTFPGRSSSCRSASGVEGQGPARLRRRLLGARPVPPKHARRIFHSVKAPHRMTSVQPAKSRRPQGHHRPRVGAAGVSSRPDDILTMGLPTSAVQRQLDPQPDPGGLPRTRLLLQPLPGKRWCARAAC